LIDVAFRLKWEKELAERYSRRSTSANQDPAAAEEAANSSDQIRVSVARQNCVPYYSRTEIAHVNQRAIPQFLDHLSSVGWGDLIEEHLGQNLQTSNDRENQR
jgi:hypothetical protein